jgi:hypothetical protein
MDDRRILPDRRKFPVSAGRAPARRGFRRILMQRNIHARAMP